MGMFDFLKKNKCLRCEKKIKASLTYCNVCNQLRENEKLIDNELNLRVNWSETEDIGIVTHYDGKPYTGVCFRLHKNGNVEEECDMVKGLKHGTSKVYDSNKKLVGVIDYNNDEEIYRQIYDKDQNLVSSHEIPEGIEKLYYPNGNIGSEGYRKNKNPEGLWKWYYESGNLEYEINYKNGKEEGFFKIYYENGNLKAEINFKDGIQHGLKTEYHEDGKLDIKSDFKNGKLDQIIEEYFYCKKCQTHIENKDSYCTLCAKDIAQQLREVAEGGISEILKKTEDSKQEWDKLPDNEKESSLKELNKFKKRWDDLNLLI
jgi:antitoxin component YwqK of YwqJK toxin-antitoxin module